MMTLNLGRIATRLALIALLMLVLPGAALADGGEGGYEASADGYHFSLVFSGPVKTGQNEFHVLITDTMGMPVSGAMVEVIAMPAGEMAEHDEQPAEEMHGMEMATPIPAPADDHGMPGMEPSHDAPAATPAPADAHSMPEMEPTSPVETETHDEGEGEARGPEPVAVSLASGHEAGEYSGEIDLATSGNWTFSVHFTLDGQMSEVEIPVEVARASSNVGILAGFFGINATVLAAAAIFKRKTTLEKA